jgi:hypothetical protein
VQPSLCLHFRDEGDFIKCTSLGSKDKNILVL